MIFDIILIVILVGFVAKGFRLGFIEGLGGLIGLIVGLILAAYYYIDLADYLIALFMNNETVARIVCFILIFILVNRFIATAFWIFDKMFKIVAIIPFLKTFNRLLGAALGFIEGVIFIGVILSVLVNFTTGPYWDGAVEGSKTATILKNVSGIVGPLIPKATDQIKNYIPNNLPNLNSFNLPNYDFKDLEKQLKK